MIKAQKKWAQRKTLDRTFKIGDRVWLEGRNLHLDRPSIKLSPKRHGPFKIKKVLSPITYQLDLPVQWKIHDVFHINLLTPYVTFSDYLYAIYMQTHLDCSSIFQS